MNQAKAFISANTKRESVIIFLDEILYIERHKRKVFVVTDEFDIEYSEKMRNIVPLLEENFIKVIESCYINLDKVKRVIDCQVIFCSGRTIYISQRNYPRIKRRHHAYHKLEQLKMVNEKNTCL